MNLLSQRNELRLSLNIPFWRSQSKTHQNTVTSSTDDVQYMSTQWMKQSPVFPTTAPYEASYWTKMVCCLWVMLFKGWQTAWDRKWVRLAESDATEATSLSLFTFMHWRRKRQSTPVFLPAESQGRGSLMGCHLWGRTESDTTEVT